jgi:hypothetical protein
VETEKASASEPLTAYRNKQMTSKPRWLASFFRDLGSVV